MVLAFVQAEIDSARFGPRYAAILSNSGLERSSIVDEPNLQSDTENRIRRELLTAVRGYGNRTLLFKGFPQNVTWRKVAIEAEDFGKLKYANYVTWVQLSGGSRLVIDGARRAEATQVGENANENIKAVTDDLRAGKRYPALIAVESEGSSLVLVEGHTRATACVLAQGAKPVEVIAGYSPQMQLWTFY
jgi:hypothetical protein